MITNKQFNILEFNKYFQYEILDKSGIKQDIKPYFLFTTKNGGVSNGRYKSLNMGYSTNDLKSNVYKNREIVLKDFGLNIKDIVSSDQVHGTKLKIITDSSLNIGECDGIFTNKKNIVLAMYFADCVPLYFYDLKNNAIGISHAGWRGTKENIAQKSINFMKENFNSDEKDIKVIIGPSIGYCCFKVKNDVVFEFYTKLSDLNINLNKHIKKIHNNEYYINLREINYEILISTGIIAENIFIHDICTFCRNDLFYSYRRDLGDTGRMAALAFLI